MPAKEEVEEDEFVVETDETTQIRVCMYTTRRVIPHDRRIVSILVARGER